MPAAEGAKPLLRMPPLALLRAAFIDSARQQRKLHEVAAVERHVEYAFFRNDAAYR